MRKVKTGRGVTFQINAVNSADVMAALACAVVFAAKGEAEVAQLTRDNVMTVFPDALDMLMAMDEQDKALASLGIMNWVLSAAVEMESDEGKQCLRVFPNVWRKGVRRMKAWHEKMERTPPMDRLKVRKEVLLFHLLPHKVQLDGVMVANPARGALFGALMDVHGIADILGG